MFGVIDRFEGTYIIVVMDNGEVVNYENTKMPLKAKVGDVIRVDEIITIDEIETNRRKLDIEKLLTLWEDGEKL